MTSIAVRTPDGTMNTELFAPGTAAGKGPFPAVLVYFDAFGLRDSMRTISQKIADDGYVVALPNIFYRAGDYKPFDTKTAFTDPKERERLFGIMHQASVPAVMKDTTALMDVLDGRSDVKKGHFATTGYCMGGRLSYAAAGTFGDRLKVALGFHAGHIVGDDDTSPHKLTPSIKARVYLGVADDDQSCSPEAQSTLAKMLGEAHVHYTIELYQGAKHGFAVSDHTSAYDKASAERHWKRTFEVLGESLKGNEP